MAKELKHKDAGTQLTHTEDHAIDRHYITGGVANDIPVYDATNAKLIGKTPTEIVAILAEDIQDTVGAMLTGNTETFITATYQDTDGTIDFVVPVKDEDDLASDSATHLATQQSLKAYIDAHAGATSEQIQDVAGAMVTGNTETFIAVTYQDADATIDFVVPVKDEDNMASDSATFLATQQSIKAYADLRLLISEIDDTPVNGVTTAPISSNWAYDHVAAADPHTGYVLESLFDADTFLYASSDNTPVATSPANVLAALTGHAGAAFDWNDQDLTGAGSVTIDAQTAQALKAEYTITTQQGAWVHGVKVELTRGADIQPSTGCWFGGQFVLNAGSSGYTDLDKPAYALQAIFKGSDVTPDGVDINVARFEVQSAGTVGEMVYLVANTGCAVSSMLELATHITSATAMMRFNVQSSQTVLAAIDFISGAGSSYNYGLDFNSAVINTADIRFSNGTTLTDDGTSLTLSGANLVGTLGAVTLAGAVSGNAQTISNANVTVGTGRTLDVSSGTLTLAADQISGDKVEGGTIASTTITTLSCGTLNGVGTIDATTEATIESAIDTLANLTSVQGHTLTLTGAFIRSGAHSLTLTTTNTTDVTLPTTGTLATLAGTEELDNKTLDSSVAKGTWTASGTWTLPALTLGGTVTGGSQDVDSLGHVGIGDDAEADVNLYIKASHIDPSSIKVAFQPWQLVYKTDGDAAFKCQSIYAVSGVGNTNTANFTSTGGALQTVNARIMMVSGNTGDVASARVFSSWADIADGTLTTLHHLYISNPDISGTGAITTQYGIYITNLVAASTNWAIYTDGSAASRFGGAVTIVGTTTIATALTGVIRADSGVLSVDSDVTDIVTAATLTAAGKVELATGAETNTGTDATRAVTPDGLDDWTGSAQITTVGTLSAGDVTAQVSAASDSAAGKAELATAAETTTGTDATRTITPDGLAGSDFGKKTVSIKVFDDATAVATGDGKFHFFCPATLNGMNLVAVSAGVSTVSSSGLPTVQIHNLTHTADMLSTVLTIDENEKHSKDAATPAVIDGAEDDVVTGDELRIDVDVAGTGTKGLQIDLIFQLP